MQLRIQKHTPDGELKLTRLQQMAIDTPEFWRDWKSEEPQNLMVQGATSAGKTLLAELAIIDTLAHDRRRAIILVPLKSMVNERRKQFSNDMDPYFRVYAASSDYMEYDERLIKGDYDVAVIVYEKFFAMLSQVNQQIMKNCGLLVVDELAMLSKEQRGPKLELALEIIRKNHPDTRIMCLATSDCSSGKICRWLNIDKNHQIFSAARPVALEEHILLLNGVGRYRTIPADCEELTVVSSQKLKEEHLAPYYLSLLMDSNRKTFTQEQIDTLFKDSLTHVCRENRTFNADKLYNALYNAYLANVSTDGGKGRGRELVQQYEIEKFGMHMAPYAFSVETCIDIYEKFYDGRKNHGLPWEITSEDVENDRYLLDILYHVCRHTEIENSSMLSYPKDDRNPSRLRKAKTLVISQLKNILVKTDSEGSQRYELWEQSEYSDLYRLITEINLGNEDCIAEAAMRAVLLFYWTKGKTVREICRITEFSSFTKITSGDIDRIAEVASFHLDAINKCLSSAEIKNDSVVDSFYILQCRVKYGMTWDLVRLANKHVHGLDRNKLLQLEKAANERGMKPVDYLYCASVEELEEYITQTQRNSLMETLERRGEASGFTSLLEVVYKDAGFKLTNQQKKSIERIYSFESQTVGSLYNDIRDTVNDNDLLPNIKVVSDGYPELLLWQSEKYGDIHIGILLDYQNQEQIDRVNRYFSKAREKRNAYFLLMPKCGETKDWKSTQSKAAETLRCEIVFDNEFFAMVLANAILKAIVEEDPLTAFFRDARGVFTVDEYKYFSLENYIGNGPTVSQSKLYLICDRSRLAYSNRFINLSELQTQIGKSVQYDVLPWGDILEHMDTSVLEAPIVLILEREMITRSRSLHIFMNRLNQNRFRNNLLILVSEDAQRKWKEPNHIETQTVGECHWNRDFCGVDQIVLQDTSSAAKAILDYCDTWKPGQFTIGI